MKKMLSKQIVWIAGASLVIAGSAMAGGKRSQNNQNANPSTSGSGSTSKPDTSSSSTGSDTSTSSSGSPSTGSTTGSTTGSGMSGSGSTMGSSTGGTSDGAQTPDSTRTSGYSTNSAGENTSDTSMGSHMGSQASAQSIPHVTIEFSPGSALLTQTETAKIRDLVASSKSGGMRSKGTTIAAWSDRALPRTSGQKLSDADRDLAEKRADAIKSYLKDEQNVSTVDTYNLADDSNWLARTFKTSDSELRSVFGKKGSETPVTHSEFKVIQNEGGPSTAVVVIEQEHSMSMSKDKKQK